MEAAAVHSLDQDHMAAGIDDGTEIAILAWPANSTAVAMILFAPRCVRRLLSATNMAALRSGRTGELCVTATPPSRIIRNFRMLFYNARVDKAAKPGRTMRREHGRLPEILRR